MSVYDQISGASESGKKLLAVLIDPDELNDSGEALEYLGIIGASGVDLVFYGGSLMAGSEFENGLQRVRKQTNLPIVLFPGSALQVSASADAILFTTLISGRNPEYLIGQQILAAPGIKASGIEVIPTGYMLIDSGRPTTASYVSNTAPIPHDKPEIAATTALAGEMLGLRIMYLDGGSGARDAVSSDMIRQVRSSTSLPLIVGGGINTPDDLLHRFNAGADVAVIGTAAEKDPFVLRDMVMATRETF